MQRLIYLLSIVMVMVFNGSEVKAADTSCVSLNQLNWLLGKWQTQPDGNTQETWQKLSADTFTGVGSSRNKAGVVQHSESMRLLEMQNELFYVAKVGHNSLPVSFRAKNCTPNTVTFENSSHDFPTELTYFRSENTIQVNVSGIDGKGFKVQYELMAEE